MTSNNYLPPTRVSSFKPNIRQSSFDPLSLVKASSNPLAAKANQTINVLEKQKSVQVEVTDKEDSWMSELDNWKSKRQTCQPRTHNLSIDSFSLEEDDMKSSLAIAKPRISNFSKTVINIGAEDDKIEMKPPALEYSGNKDNAKPLSMKAMEQSINSTKFSSETQNLSSVLRGETRSSLSNVSSSKQNVMSTKLEKEVTANLGSSNESSLSSETSPKLVSVSEIKILDFGAEPRKYSNVVQGVSKVEMKETSRRSNAWTPQSQRPKSFMFSDNEYRPKIPDKNFKLSRDTSQLVEVLPSSNEISQVKTLSGLDEKHAKASIHNFKMIKSFFEASGTQNVERSASDVKSVKPTIIRRHNDRNVDIKKRISLGPGVLENATRMSKIAIANDKEYIIDELYVEKPKSNSGRSSLSGFGPNSERFTPFVEKTRSSNLKIKESDEGEDANHEVKKSDLSLEDFQNMISLPRSDSNVTKRIGTSKSVSSIDKPLEKDKTSEHHVPDRTNSITIKIVDPVTPNITHKDIVSESPKTSPSQQDMQKNKFSTRVNVTPEVEKDDKKVDRNIKTSFISKRTSSYNSKYDEDSANSLLELHKPEVSISPNISQNNRDIKSADGVGTVKEWKFFIPKSSNCEGVNFQEVKDRSLTAVDQKEIIKTSKSGGHSPSSKEKVINIEIDLNIPGEKSSVSPLNKPLSSVEQPKSAKLIREQFLFESSVSSKHPSVAQQFDSKLISKTLLKSGDGDLITMEDKTQKSVANDTGWIGTISSDADKKFTSTSKPNLLPAMFKEVKVDPVVLKVKQNESISILLADFSSDSKTPNDVLDAAKPVTIKPAANFPVVPPKPSSRPSQTTPPNRISARLSGLVIPLGNKFPPLISKVTQESQESGIDWDAKADFNLLDVSASRAKSELSKKVKKRPPSIYSPYRENSFSVHSSNASKNEILTEKEGSLVLTEVISDLKITETVESKDKNYQQLILLDDENDAPPALPSCPPPDLSSPPSGEKSQSLTPDDDFFIFQIEGTKATSGTKILSFLDDEDSELDMLSESLI